MNDDLHIVRVQPIRVIVDGTVNSGKSTISRLIAETLRNAGFDVIVHDEPLAEGWDVKIPERVERLKQRGLKIDVVTQQRPRY